MLEQTIVDFENDPKLVEDIEAKMGRYGYCGQCIKEKRESSPFFVKSSRLWLGISLCIFLGRRTQVNFASSQVFVFPSNPSILHSSIESHQIHHTSSFNHTKPHNATQEVHHQQPVLQVHAHPEIYTRQHRVFLHPSQETTTTRILRIRGF